MTGDRQIVPRKWARVPLSALVDIQYGKNLPMREFVGEGFPVFGANGQIGFYSEFTHEEAEVLIGCRGSCGIIRMSEARSFVTNNAMVLQPFSSQHLIRPFLRLAMLASDRSEAITGTAQPQITITNLARQHVLLAPLPEQRRIVAKIEELFSELDAGVAALERAQVRLERYRASVLKAAVEGSLTEEWRRDNPPEESGEKLLQRSLAERRKRWEEDQLAKYKAKGKKPPKAWKERYKEPVAPDASGLPRLPEGWCWAALDQVFHIITGAAFKKRDYGEEGLPLLQIANVGFGDVLWNQRNYLPRRFSETHEALMLETGDLVMALNRPILGGKLKIAKLGPRDVPAVLYQRVARLRAFDSHCARFFFHCLTSPHAIQQARERLQGTDQPYLNTSLLPEIVVPVPPLAEQRQIERALDNEITTIDLMKSATVGGGDRARALRQSILKRAFQGKLVPQDPNDEPASVLLERTRAVEETAKPEKKRGQPRITAQHSLDI